MSPTITEEELKIALDKVSSGKTPGIDGIEQEFLIRFWKLIRKTIPDATEIFVEALSKSYKKVTLMEKN